MKRFISGFIIGALIFGVLGAAAVSYVAEPAGFKILVNGKEFTSDPPALVVEGRTYLPLRAMGDALGVPVEWNAELGQAEVGNSAPVADAGQYSRTNPAPLNTVQTYVKNEEYLPDYNYSATIRVIETERGASAWQKIKESNTYNKEPEEGYEYIIAKVAFSLLSSYEDKVVDADEYKFKAFSGNNEEYKSVFVLYDNKLDTKLFPGGNAEGYVIFQVRATDLNPKFVYGMNYDGTGGVWFNLQ